MKICTECKKELDISNFSSRGRKGKNKKLTLHPKCKPCRCKVESKLYHNNSKRKEKTKETAKKHHIVYRTRNFNYIKDYKADKGCQKCGENDYVALDAHHIDPTIKKHNLSILAKSSFSLEVVIEELNKCIILCSNCHRKFHAGRFKLEDCSI